MKEIVVKESFKLPGLDKPLEEGDVIQLVSEGRNISAIDKGNSQELHSKEVNEQGKSIWYVIKFKDGMFLGSFKAGQGAWAFTERYPNEINLLSNGKTYATINISGDFNVYKKAEEALKKTQQNMYDDIHFDIEEFANFIRSILTFDLMYNENM